MATPSDSVAGQITTVLWRARLRPHPRRPGELKRFVVPVAFALLVLALWELYVSVSGISEASLPAPSKIAEAAWNMRSLLLSNGWVTLQEILLGFMLAIVVGVVIAVLVVCSRTVELALSPWLIVSQTVPVPAVAPIFVIWFGFDLRPKLLVIALTTFFPIVVNTIDGLKSTDPELLNLLRTLGAGRWRRLRVAQAPAALPFFFSGLRVAAVFSVIGAVFAEWVGASSGLGYLILTFNNETETTNMFATVFALSLIGIGLYFFVAGVERIALPWYREGRRGEVDRAAPQ
jgi:ABC-type nitrate/sulfonate/bicarbonate transport system permease component